MLSKNLILILSIAIFCFACTKKEKPSKSESTMKEDVSNPAPTVAKEELTTDQWIEQTAGVFIDHLCRLKCSRQRMKCLREKDQHSLADSNELLQKEGPNVWTYNDTLHPETGKIPEKYELLEFEILDNPHRCIGKVKFTEKNGHAYTGMASVNLD